MKNYSVAFHHSEETILALSLAQFRTTNRMQTAAMELTCAAAITMGVLGVGGSSAQVILLALGILGLTMLLDTPKRRSKQVLQHLKGRFPYVEYHFTEEEMKFFFDGKEETHAYGKLTRLIEDKAYCYLVCGDSAIFGVPKEKIEDTADFQAFLTKKTGKIWEENRSILVMSLKELVKKRLPC